jgi:hypothetical protein
MINPQEENTCEGICDICNKQKSGKVGSSDGSGSGGDGDCDGGGGGDDDDDAVLKKWLYE